MNRYYVIFEGRVQGVGFRYFCQMTATNFNLSGWVRNLSNGMVDMEIQGNEEIIHQYLNTINKGNYFIRVTNFSKKKIDLVPNEKKFVIK